MEIHLEIKAPFRVVYFSWLIPRETCLTQDKLQRRGFQLCSRCFLCGATGENNSYLLIHCPVIGQLWQLFLNMVVIRWSVPATSVALLKCWNQNDETVSQKIGGNSSLLACGGPFGRRGTIELLKTNIILWRKSRRIVYFCFIFGVKKANVE